MPEPIVSLNEETLRDDLRELVRKTVEELLNGLLEEEAGDLVGAERYERTAERGPTGPGTTTGSSPPPPARSRSGCPSSRELGSPPLSSSATAGARPRSRRP